MTDTIYKWKRGGWAHLDVNEVVAELDDLAATSAVTPDAIVERARPITARLHSAFEWDDNIAGEEWRRHQAGHMVRSIVRVVARDDDDDENMHTRAFVSVRLNASPEYVSTPVVLSDVRLRQQLLASALRDLESFRRKYEELKELVPIFAALDLLRSEAATGAPLWPGSSTVGYQQGEQQ